jgi:DNA-binding transcriptional LysR family regulator
MDFSIQMLRILCETIETKSFSEAAKRLKITQPTVSQQIARLEKELDGKIFERAGREIHITSLGEKIYQTAKDILLKTESFKEELHNEKNTLAGIVRYGMPESCQWTPHYKNIMSIIKNYPLIEFEIHILPNTEIVEMLKKGSLDFGFIVGEKTSPDLRYEKFGDEHYSLVANSPALLEMLSKKQFKDVRIVGYPGHEKFFILGAEEHKIFEDLKKHILHPTVKVGNMIGAIHATIAGAGISFFPTHCIAEEIETKKLYVYNPHENKDVSQPIYFAKHISTKLSPRAETIATLLKESKLAK